MECMLYIGHGWMERRVEGSQVSPSPVLDRCSLLPTFDDTVLFLVYYYRTAAGSVASRGGGRERGRGMGLLLACRVRAAEIDVLLSPGVGS